MRHTLAKLLPTLAAIVGCAISPQVFAQSQAAPSAEQAFRAFLACDASFFTTLKSDPSALGPQVEVASRGSAASPVVNDPLSSPGRSQTFTAPLELGDLTLLGWRNEVTHTPQGSLLFWGFQVAGSTEAAVQAINARLPANQRMVKEKGGYWARSEMRTLKDPADTWRGGGFAGVVTPKGTVERILMINTDTRAPTDSVIYCSLQGSITPELLQSTRPDLIEREYP